MTTFVIRTKVPESELVQILQSIESYSDVASANDEPTTRRSNIVPLLVDSMVEVHGDTLFCSLDSSRDWYRWNAKYWEPVDLSEVL